MNLPQPDYPKVIAMVIIAEAVGFLGAIFTAPAIATWYAALQKPFFTPPGWLFAPAWTILYVLMGVAAGTVWSKTGFRTKELKFYWTQLFLNFLWSLTFFGLKLPGLALMEIALLWAFIWVTMQSFYPVCRKAFWLMVPYIIWVTFASLLNFGIIVLNT